MTDFLQEATWFFEGYMCIEKILWDRDRRFSKDNKTIFSIIQIVCCVRLYIKMLKSDIIGK
jgi:hypothetical protein